MGTNLRSIPSFEVRMRVRKDLVVEVDMAAAVIRGIVWFFFNWVEGGVKSRMVLSRGL